MSKRKKFACYSQKMADLYKSLINPFTIFGNFVIKTRIPYSVIYLNEKGEEVECTAVCNDYECDIIKWDDKVLLGEVVKYVRGNY